MGKKPKFILSGIIFLLIGFIIAAFFYVNSPQFKQQAAKYISTQIENTLGDKIDMDAVYLVSANSAAVDNIKIYDKNNELIGSADKIVFTADIMAMLKQSPLAGLSEIEIEKPDINLVKRDDGKWNVEDLLNSDSNTSMDFRGKVKVNDGNLTAKFDGKEISATQINVQADCADIDAVKITGDLMRNDANFSVDGTIGTDENTNIDIKAENINVMEYLPYIPQDKLNNIDIKSGHIDKADIKVVSDFKGSYLFNGAVRFKDVGVEAQGYDVQNVEGIALLQNQNLQLFVKGQIKGQNVAVHGRVMNYMTEPDLRLVVESKDFRPEVFLDNSPFVGSVAINAAVYGKVDDIKVGAQVKADSATIYGYDVKDIAVEARYNQNQIFIDDLRADFAGGWLWASGMCNIADMSYKGTFKFANIDLSVLNAYVPDLKGIAMAQGDFKGQETNTDGLNISGRLEVNNGSYQNIPVDKLEASFYKQGDKWQIDAMSAQLAGGGTIAAKGGLENNTLNADFYASNINMDIANQFAGQLDLQGIANFKGHVSGNMDNPVLQINIMARDGSVMYQPFDTLFISAIGNLDGMRIDTAEMVKNSVITHQATGLLGFKGSKFIDMTVKTQSARMENLIQAVMPDLKITGNVDNTLHLTGNLDDIQASGKLHFYEGSLNGILISEINGSYEYKDGDTFLNNFVITSPFIKANLNGSIDRNQSFNLKLQANEILLDKVQVDLPYPVSGRANFDGTLQGQIGALNFDGTFTADDIVLNGEDINNVYGRLKLANRILQLEQFSFNQKDGQWALNASVDLNSKTIKGAANIVNADINAAMAMANLKNDLLKGNFNGGATIDGTYEQPKVYLKGNMPQGSLKDFPLQNIELDAQLDNTLIKLNRFYGEQGAGKIAAQGSVDYAGGPLDGRISASNMDINLLTHLCDLNVDLTGTMNGDVQLSGTINNPVADITLSANGGGKQFDTAYILANLKDNVISINQAAITKGACAIKSNGTIPIAALDTSKRTVASENEKMNLKVYLDNTDLSILPSFTPYVEWAMGNVQGNLNISGTVSEPEFKGNLTTADSAIKFKYVDSPIQNMNADIEFNNNLMTVKQFDGVVGTGTYTLQGSSNITSAGLTNYNFTMNLNHLDIVSDYYTGPLNGSVQINQIQFRDRFMPKLTANFDFNDLTVSMPPLPETSDEPLPNMALDINVNLGDNVHAYDSLLYDLYLQGAFSIKGTTRHPDSSGKLTANRGTINVLKTIFDIGKGDITFNQVDSFFPSIDFLAMTRLDRVKVFASLQGPLDKELTPKLYSEPAMNESEIIKLLAFRTDYKEGNSGELTSSDLASLATVGIQMSFLNEIEGNLRNVLDLDLLRISRNTLSDSDRKRFATDNNEVYNVEIGKYLSDKFMLKYTQGINYDYNNIGLQYYINNNLDLTGGVDNGGAFNIKVEMQWNF